MKALAARDHRESAWLVATAVAATLVLWFRYLNIDVLPFFGARFDQTMYMQQAYMIFETLRESMGWESIAKAATINNWSSSIFPHMGAASMALFGPGRLPLYLVNIGWLVAMLYVLNAHFPWQTGAGPVVPRVASLLLLMSAFLFATPGGASDYRPDFTASMMYGITLVFLLRSELFQHSRWALAAGLMAGFMVINRHNTAMHLLPLAPVLAWCLLSARSGRRKGALLFIAPFLIVIPVLYLRLDEILKFYNPKRFLTRNNSDMEFTYSTDWWLSVSYYPKTMVNHVLGWPLFSLVAVAAIAGLTLFLIRKLRRKETSVTAPPHWLSRREVWICAVAVAWPYLVLTWHHNKREDVISIVLVPFLLLVSCGLAGLLARWLPQKPLNQVLIPLAAVAVLGAAINSKVGGHIPARGDRTSFNLVYDRVVTDAIDRNEKVVRIFQVSGSSPFWHQAFANWAYERYRTLIRGHRQVLGLKGNETAAEREAAIREKLLASHVVIYNPQPQGWGDRNWRVQYENRDLIKAIVTGERFEKGPVIQYQGQEYEVYYPNPAPGPSKKR